MGVWLEWRRGLQGLDRGIWPQFPAIVEAFVLRTNETKFVSISQRLTIVTVTRRDLIES